MKSLLILLFILTGFAATAQTAKPLEENPEAPYKRVKAMPAFKAVYLNGKDTFNTYDIPTGKPALIFYFSPDCDHCKKVLDAMLPQMDKLKNVNVYMMSFMPPIAIQVFNSTYHLEKYPCVKFIGHDYAFFFPSFYGVTSVPNVVLYDKNKQFVKIWKNDVTMEQILAELK